MVRAMVVPPGAGRKRECGREPRVRRVDNIVPFRTILTHTMNLRFPFLPSCPSVAERQVFLRTVIRFFAYALPAVGVAWTARTDLVVFGNGMGECSFTEWFQMALVLFALLTFRSLVPRYPAFRGFSILSAGFFGCILFREMDFYFNPIAPWFWVLPVACVLVWSFRRALSGETRGTVWPGMAAFCRSSACETMLVGLVLVLGFSRVFGSGRLLWRHVVCSTDATLVKSAVQESLEFLGYLWMAIAAFRWRRILAAGFPPSGGSAS